MAFRLPPWAWFMYLTMWTVNGDAPAIGTKLSGGQGQDMSARVQHDGQKF